jgi:hypothetical protein
MSLLEKGGRDGITCISNFSGHASRIRFDTASSFMKTNYTYRSNTTVSAVYADCKRTGILLPTELKITTYSDEKFRIIQPKFDGLISNGRRQIPNVL